MLCELGTKFHVSLIGQKKVYCVNFNQNPLALIGQENQNFQWRGKTLLLIHALEKYRKESLSGYNIGAIVFAQFKTRGCLFYPFLPE